MTKPSSLRAVEITLRISESSSMKSMFPFMHALIIPKGEYIDLDDFNQKASDQEIVAISKAITEVSRILGVSADTGKGYRALTNLGEHGGQEVPHLHFHLFGGEKIGKMVE